MASAVSIREFMSPVQDQGNRGTCTVFAAIGLLEYIFDYTFSEEWLAYFSSQKDYGYIEQRAKWTSTHGLTKEEECTYHAAFRRVALSSAESNLNPIPLKFDVETQSAGKVDSIAFLKGKVSQGSPVGISIEIIGKTMDYEQ